jgi:hypothetical protein
MDRRRSPLTGLEFVVCVLAAYRGTRALIRDSITDELRDRYALWSANGGKVRQKLGDLGQCPFCAGFHLSWITYLVMISALDRRRRAPFIVHVVWAWAVAGGQALLNRADDAVAD